MDLRPSPFIQPPLNGLSPLKAEQTGNTVSASLMPGLPPIGEAKVSQPLLDHWQLKPNIPFQALVLATKVPDNLPAKNEQALVQALLAIQLPLSTGAKASDTIAPLLQIISPQALAVNSTLTLKVDQQNRLQILPPLLPTSILKQQASGMLLEKINAPSGTGLFESLANTLQTFTGLKQNTAETMQTLSPALTTLRSLLKQLPEAATVHKDYALLKNWVDGITRSPGNQPSIESGLTPNRETLPDQLIRQLKIISDALKESALRELTSPNQKPAFTTESMIKSAEQAELFSMEIKNQLLIKSVAETLHVLSKKIIEKIHLQQLLNKIQVHNPVEKKETGHEKNISTEARQNLFTEIPIRYGHQFGSVQLWLERETVYQKNKSGNISSFKKGWNAHLDFDLPTLGLLQAKATLLDTRIKVVFFTMEPRSKDIVNTHLPLLHIQLQHSGMEVDALNCQLGRLAVPTPLSPFHLIDTRG